MQIKNRYTRLPAGEALGFKIATRKEINIMLTDFEAYDADRFLRALKALFGKPDQIGDGRLSYSIKDNTSKISFEAFSGNSGPAYGGTVDHFDDLASGKLKAPVMQTLIAFDNILETATNETDS